MRRFAPFHADNRWLRDRVAEVLGLHYAVPWPNRELETARDVRLSPLHERLAARGAVFGSRMGWERPNVFAPSRDEARLDYAWGKPGWLPWSCAEQRATRQTVAVFDQTSFSKYVVTGSGALAALQWVCANDVDVAPGTAVYTPLLNRRGAYESDLTVTRVAADEFLLVSSSATTVRDQDWIRRQVPDGLEVDVRDETSSYAVLGVMGPRSRDLLTRLTDADLGEEGFPFATSRLVTLGGRRGAGDPDDVRRGAGLGADGAGRPGGRGVRRRWWTRAPTWASRTPATTRSSRCGWRRGSARSAASSRPDFTPVEAGLVFATGLDKRRRGLPGPRRRWPRTGSGCAAPDRVGGWCPSWSRTRSRCCGAASCCCTTAARWAR